jgi:hypothetical protein
VNVGDEGDTHLEAAAEAKYNPLPLVSVPNEISAEAPEQPEGRGEPPVRWSDLWPVALLIIGLVIAVGAPFVTARLDEHRAESYLLTWTALAAAFSATTFAFLIGLAWDRRQRTLVEQSELEADRRRQEADLKAEDDRRALEAKRRFAAIGLELEHLKATLDRCADQGKYKYFFPSFPTGSWEAASSPLGIIVANYGLMAELSTFYGQVAELQWRLRFKANAWVEDETINPIIDALVEQMRGSVDGLIRHVQHQTVSPDVERVHREVAPVAGLRPLTRAIRGLTVGRQRLPTADRES